MNAKNEKMAALSGDRELVSTRIFSAPRDLVWDVWTRPEHIAKWWGPNGFSTTIHEMDVRTGGIWHLILHGPDGRDYNNYIRFIEVVKPERLVFKHDPKHSSEGVSHQTEVTFIDRGEETEVHFRMSFVDPAARDYAVNKHRALDGLNQTLGRLVQYLQALPR